MKERTHSVAGLSRAFCLLLCFFTVGGIVPCLSQQLPLKPARTISFTTNEGSYMSVDISPDGKTLLFDMLGDLFSVPATGGNAKQLTMGLALNVRPIWSPDGKKIVYISDVSGEFHLNIRNISGAFHKVLSGKSDISLRFGQYWWPTMLWTHDSRYIAMDGTLYDVNGGNVVPSIPVSNPMRFSNDGRLVYYLVYSAGLPQLWRYDTDKKVKTLISPGLARKTVSGTPGTLSPNGRYWSFIADSNAQRCLIVHDLETQTKRILISSFSNGLPNYKQQWVLPRYTFSPDSKDIFIGYGGKIHRIDVESGTDRIIPFTAHVNVDLAALNYNTFPVSQDSVKVRYTRSTNASPDGNHLVFSALNKLFEMDLPNGKPYVLASQSLEQCQPVYSPDGKWVAYVSWHDTLGGFLYKVPAGGGIPEQLTSIPGQYQRPAWSPNGKLIAVIKGRPGFGDRDDPGMGQLQLVPVNGGRINIIADSIPLWNQLSFSPDGSRITYESKRIDRSKSSVVSTDLEGRDRRVLAVSEEGGSEGSLYIQQKLISPDGRFMVFSADEDLYMVSLGKLDNPQIIYDIRQKLPLIRFARGVDPHWENEGKILSWTYGNKFYRVNPEKITATAGQDSKLSGENFTTIQVKPDQIIDLSITVPYFHANGMLALTNVRIITMQRDRVIEHGTVIMENGRFLAVGPAAAIEIPKSAKVLDLKGKTVMPGLIDLHDHMRVPPDVYPEQSWMFLANLAYGVTTARDPSHNFDAFGYKELLETGQMIGPRLYTVGRSARIADGMVKCDNLEDARALVQKRVELGGKVIKQYNLPTRQQRQWLSIACHEAGLNMTNEGDQDPILQFAMIKDGSTGVEHNPVWFDAYKDVISLVTKSGTYITPVLQASYGTEAGRHFFNFKYWRQPDPKLTRFIFNDPPRKVPLDIIRKAHPKDTLNPGFMIPAAINARFRHHGGLVAMGSHGDDEGIGAHSELWALQMGGMTNMEALQAATIMGAKALGIQKNLGSIEKGKIADLIVLNKNPLDDIHNSREILYVIKDGIIYDGDTLDEIWPEQKKCPEWRLKK
jgi:Tol biopolymer transport system component